VILLALADREFFKLLKSAGHEIEHWQLPSNSKHWQSPGDDKNWQQETGTAIARRLLVAAMACVVA
jgi:hypothetical protein